MNVSSRQGAETTTNGNEVKQTYDFGRDWRWLEASIWTKGMLTALGNGVKGGKYEDHKKWPNAYFAKLGLFTMAEARALMVASQSRCGNC